MVKRACEALLDVDKCSNLLALSQLHARPPAAERRPQTASRQVRDQISIQLFLFNILSGAETVTFIYVADGSSAFKGNYTYKKLHNGFHKAAHIQAAVIVRIKKDELVRDLFSI